MASENCDCNKSGQQTVAGIFLHENIDWNKQVGYHETDKRQKHCNSKSIALLSM